MSFFKSYGDIIGAGVGALADIGTTAMVNSANRKENETAREFAKQQQEDSQEHDIAIQHQQFQNQMQLQGQAQQAQQVYYDRNLSMIAQRKQIEKAGLNPYLALDGNGGSGVSVPSGSAAAPTGGAVGAPTPVPMQKAQVAQSFSQMISALADADLKGKEAHGIEIDNMFKMTDKMLDQRGKILDNINKGIDVEKNKKELKRIDLDLQYLRDSLQDRLKGVKLSNDQTEQAIAESKSQENLNNAMAEIEKAKLPYIPQEASSRIEYNISQAGYYEAMKIRTEKMTPEEVERLQWEIAEKKFNAVIHGYTRENIVLSDADIKKMRSAFVNFTSSEISNNSSGTARNFIEPFLDAMMSFFMFVALRGRGPKPFKGFGR